MKYLFLHVPKTAGTSLRKALLSQFPEDQVAECYRMGHIPEQLQGAFQKQKKLIYGHINFAHLAKTGIPEDYQMLAFVRHPVQRAISTYIHFLHDHDEARREEVTGMGNFEGYLETTFGNNWLCRYFAGTVNDKGSELEGEALYRKARENFDRLAWVGVAERYTESLISLQHFMELKPISYMKSNLSRDKQLKGELENNFHGIIMDRNRQDLKLWKLANQRLDEQLRAVPFVPFKKVQYNLFRIFG